MYKDPVTGDPLTRAEYVSWRIQAVIRNFWFLGLFTLATVLVWAFGSHAARDWWNLTASFLAIVIESIVGMAMFGQTRRDATYIRRIARLEEQNETQLRHLEALLAEQQAHRHEPPARGQGGLHREGAQDARRQPLPSAPDAN